MFKLDRIDGNIILNWKFFVRIAIVGLVGDLLFNYWTSNSDAKEGPIKGLKDFYESTTAWNAALWAAIIFVGVVFISILPEIIADLF